MAGRLVGVGRLAGWQTKEGLGRDFGKNQVGKKWPAPYQNFAICEHFWALGAQGSICSPRGSSLSLEARVCVEMYGFSMVLVWFQYGFSMVLVWFWYEFCMVLVEF